MHNFKTNIQIFKQSYYNQWLNKKHLRYLQLRVTKKNKHYRSYTIKIIVVFVLVDDQIQSSDAVGNASRVIDRVRKHTHFTRTNAIMQSAQMPYAICRAYFLCSVFVTNVRLHTHTQKTPTRTHTQYDTCTRGDTRTTGHTVQCGSHSASSGNVLPHCWSDVGNLLPVYTCCLHCSHTCRRVQAIRARRCRLCCHLLSFWTMMVFIF